MRALIAFLFCFSFWSIKAHAQNLCVTKEGTLLRSGPQSSAPVSWKVGRFMPLQATGQRQGHWAEVTDLDGQKHWVNRNDVTSRITCVVVRSRRVKLRTGPGTKFEISPAGIADRYSPFLDHGGEDGWTQVEDDMGQLSWIDVDQTWKPHRTIRMSFDKSEN